MQEASFLLRDEWKINWKKVQVCSCCLWTLVIFKGLMTQSLLMVSLVFSFLVQLWDGACPESAWKGDLVSPDKTCLCGNTTSVRVLIAHLSLQLPKPWNALISISRHCSAISSLCSWWHSTTLRRHLTHRFGHRSSRSAGCFHLP